MSQALVLIRELLSSVDQQVQELELTQKLQEIRARLDPRAETEVRGGVFRGGELLRRRLLHEGTLLLKTAQGSRLKGSVCVYVCVSKEPDYDPLFTFLTNAVFIFADVQVLLMTDILVFMQEKDQKYFFPCLVSESDVSETFLIKIRGVATSELFLCLKDKPSVLSLQNLIVRDIANQERGMFLISDSTPPEMYELHGASKDDRNNWMKIIQQAVSRSVKEIVGVFFPL